MPSTRSFSSLGGMWGVVVVGVAGCFSPALAQFTLPGADPNQEQTGNTLVKAAVELDGSAIVPGEPALLGVQFTIHPAWHIYWSNAGDTGAPTELSVTAPPGFKIGPIRWPRPEIFSEEGDTSFGYGKETMLFVPIVAPVDLGSEKVTIRVKTNWLVCSRDVCLFGDADLTLDVPVAKAGDTVTFQRQSTKTLFARLYAEIPKPIASMPGAKASLAETSKGPVLRIEGPARRGAVVKFLPEYTPGVRYTGKVPFVAKTTGGHFQIEVPLEITPDDALGKPLRAAGIVILGEGRESPALEVEIPIPPSKIDIDSP